MLGNDAISYDSLLDSLNGWIGYAMWVNTYKLRKSIIKKIEIRFNNLVSNKDIQRWTKSQ